MKVLWEESDIKPGLHVYYGTTPHVVYQERGSAFTDYALCFALGYNMSRFPDKLALSDYLNKHKYRPNP